MPTRHVLRRHHFEGAHCLGTDLDVVEGGGDLGDELCDLVVRSSRRLSSTELILAVESLEWRCGCGIQVGQPESQHHGRSAS